MILDRKHEQRLERISKVGKDHSNAALILMDALKKLGNVGNIPLANIQIFEDQIRGKRNG